MRIVKDKKLDVAYVQLKHGEVKQTIELRPGLLFDLDKNGQVLGIEVLSLTQVAPALMSHKKKSVSRTINPRRSALYPRR